MRGQQDGGTWVLKQLGIGWSFLKKGNVEKTLKHFNTYAL